MDWWNDTDRKKSGEKPLSYTNLTSQLNYTIYLMSTFLPRSKQTPSVLKLFSVCARLWSYFVMKVKRNMKIQYGRMQGVFNKNLMVHAANTKL
jgi:hypothetical protein